LSAEPPKPTKENFPYRVMIHRLLDSLKWRMPSDPDGPGWNLYREAQQMCYPLRTMRVDGTDENGDWWGGPIYWDESETTESGLADPLPNTEPFRIIDELDQLVDLYAGLLQAVIEEVETAVQEGESVPARVLQLKEQIVESLETDA